MLLTTRRTRVIIGSILALAMPTIQGAQARVIRVVSSDGQLVAFANVSVEGGITQITDEKGEVSLGAGKRQTLTFNVRRIGFMPWFGKIERPDTAAVLLVSLPRLAQKLGVSSHHLFIALLHHRVPNAAQTGPLGSRPRESAAI